MLRIQSLRARLVSMALTLVVVPLALVGLLS
jgi:hypothetical protein